MSMDINPIILLAFPNHHFLCFAWKKSLSDCDCDIHQPFVSAVSTLTPFHCYCAFRSRPFHSQRQFSAVEDLKGDGQADADGDWDCDGCAIGVGAGLGTTVVDTADRFGGAGAAAQERGQDASQS